MLYFCAMRKRLLWILTLAMTALFSCSRNEVPLLDAVPADADLIIESTDAAVIIMFDSLFGTHIDKSKVENGRPMAIVSVPYEGCSFLTNPSSKDVRDRKVYDDPGFQRLQKTLGQNVKAHLYSKQPEGWVMLDVLPEGNSFVLSGYALAADSTSIWRPLKYQLPVKNSVVNILPSDTRYMHHLGMSDYPSYWESFCDQEKVKTFNEKYGTDVESKLLTFFSEVSYNKFGRNQREVFVGKMNDPSAVIKFMERLASKTGVSASQNCQGYAIYDLGKNTFIPDLFGDEFNEMRRCCYAILDQYLVMAANMNIIKDVIAGYRSGRTLDMNEGFRAIQQKMTESANVTLFEIKDDRTEVLQLASSKDLVYTNAFLSWDIKAENWKSENSENSVRWKVNLDAPLKGKPFLVKNPNNSDKSVVVFDSENRIYLIDSDGAIVWKKQLSEAPMSEVFTVDSQNNGQVQLLFNTAHSLHLIDLSGNNMSGYPMPLPFEASNGLSVIDYNGNHDYRILLCGTDRLVYNYTLQGTETEGWNRHRAEEKVTLPVRHLVADNKDYLIVSDVRGGVRILDRQGRIRIPLSADIQKSPQNDIYTNATNTRKGLFLTSDKEGKLLYITGDGSQNRTDFGTYSEKHFFLYEDFNGDQDPDFIYLDGKELHVFDRFKKEIFSYHFDVEITDKPRFDGKGKMIVNSGLVGESPFAVGSLHGDRETNLIKGVGNALYNYAIR